MFYRHPAWGVILQPRTLVASGLTRAFWYDATTGVSVDGSSNVTQWNDLSGNGRHLTPVSGSANCVLTSAVQNSLNGVHINGSVGGGVNSELATAAFSLSQPFTIIAVIKTDGTPEATFSIMIDGHIGHSGDRAIFFARHDSVSSLPTLYGGVSATLGFGSILTTFPNTPYKLYGRFSGASSSGGFNGVDTPGTVDVFGIVSGLTIGNKADSSAFSAYMLEIVGFTGVSTTDLSSELARLLTKWAI